MGGKTIRYFNDAVAAGDVHYVAGVPYDSQGRLLIDSRLPRLPGRKAVLLGHSYAEKHWTVSAGESTFSPTGAFNHANALLGAPWDIVANGGVTGETAAQILARVDALLSTYSPDWVLVAGVALNDIVADATAATIIASAEQILAKLSGLNVVWCTDPPSQRNAGTAARRAVLHAFNRWLKEQAASVPGLIVVDTYSATVDTATGYGVAGMYAETTTNQLHYNTLGAASAGRAIVRAMNTAGGLLPCPVFATGCDDYKNMVYNPYMVGSIADPLAALTGVIPNGWEGAVHASGAGVGSKVATSDEVQCEWTRLAVTNAANTTSGAALLMKLRTTDTWPTNTAVALGKRISPAGSDYIYRVITVTGGATTGATEPDWSTVASVGATIVDDEVTWGCFDKPIVGDTLYAAVEVEMDSWSSNAMPALYVEYLAGASTVTRPGCLFGDGTTLPSNSTGTYILVTPALEIPATVTNVNLRIRTYGAASATGNIKIRRVGAWLTNR